ncbi:hypothetical protein ERT44_16395 [Stenotrophomonas sp. MA5]|uniref:hypothetical protein n=1 Tax=Stenotrophomonas sp. MA5 TaxID=2508572 RepID=UPI001009FCE3|nr:hypothetical protein [Stenotrophomonas sp. MA5]RXK64261.1 hypothetical protein ERT44_16395 [Stenotrophomonas sp. MA5]
MRDDVEDILDSLGIALTPAAEGGWSITAPVSGKIRHFCDLYEVRTWLASWAYTEYSEYLAIRHFRREICLGDDLFLDEVSSWLERNELTDRIVELRTSVNRIVLSDDHEFHPSPSVIVSVLRERVGRPYYSLGQRMIHSLGDEREKRRLAGS